MNPSLEKKLTGLTHLISKEILWILLGFSIFIRLVQYGINRALRADEAVLALNLIRRDYLGLIQPLEYDQVAPAGFLWVEKLLLQLFGNTEPVLRIFPLIFGVASVVLFFLIAKRFLSPIAAAIALALFGCHELLVFYSSDVKQYSSDVAIALLIFWLMTQWPQPTQRQAVILSIVGALCIWFSHPAIFVLAGCIFVNLFLTYRHQQKRHFFTWFLVGLVWLASFTSFYFLTLRSSSDNQTLLNSWGNRSSFPDVFNPLWYYDAFTHFFKDPMNFSLPGIIVSIALTIAGIVAFIRQRDRRLLYLFAPVVMTFIAACLRKYPFRERLLIFLIPFAILLIAYGWDVLREWIKTRWGRSISLSVSALLAAILLVQPVGRSLALPFAPYYHTEIRLALDYIQTHKQPSDFLYVFQRGRYQFDYYADRYGYQPGQYQIGIEDLNDGRKMSPAEKVRYEADLDTLKGRSRVWVLLAHIDHVPDELEAVQNHLAQIGKKLDAAKFPSAIAELYDFGQPPSTP